MNKYLYGHTSEETGYLVEDYPYGFRLRTKIRYWIDTTKNGDRMCSQTLNPKTGNWNKPKKSTYTEVIVMGLDEQNHVKRTSISHWDDEEKLVKWLDDKDQTKFNDLQKLQIKQLIAIFRTRKHITVEISNVTYQTDEQRAAHDKEQEEIKQKMRKIYAYYLSQP